MPVKYFVSKDSQGREWPPDTSSESAAVVDIIKRIYSAYHRNNEDTYAIVANLHISDACADIVIITNRGLGVVELKGNEGYIWQEGPYWYDKKGKIRTGSNNSPAHNPHEQARRYTLTIKHKLLTVSFPGKPWLPGTPENWRKFKFGTAVCFYNRCAQIDDIREKYQPVWKYWEAFYPQVILTPTEIPDWAYDLRFQGPQEASARYEPYMLDPFQIERIATELLKATEWTSITPRMPTSLAYAYLTLIEGDTLPTPIPLNRDSFIVGRGASGYSISNRYTQVSREHILLTRAAEGIFIKDLNSSHGTYINGKRLYGEQRLTHGQQVTLGGACASDTVCLLEFSLKEPECPPTT